MTTRHYNIWAIVVSKNTLSIFLCTSASDINTLDGIRVEFADGWGLLRCSNTTPDLVLRFEATNETALQRIKALFKEQMLLINPQLVLNF